MMAGKKNDEVITRYCAMAMQPSVQTLKKKAQHIQKRRSMEDIHDLRVSSRRIRTCLSIFESVFPQKKHKTWLRGIKNITKAFGLVRDLDVQIDLVDQFIHNCQDKSLLAGIKRIRLRLKQKRQQKQAETQLATLAILESATLLELEAWMQTSVETEAAIQQESAPLFQLAYENIQKRLDEFLFFEVFIFDPNRVDELHQMRIAAKRLRYSLEVFSALFEGKTDFALEKARQSQQMLGEIHDADVWLIYLPVFMERERKRIQDFYGYKSPYLRIKPGIEFLMANRNQEREGLYQKFLQEWKNWKLQETWLSLRKVIFLTPVQEPFNQTDSASLPTDNAIGGN